MRTLVRTTWMAIRLMKIQTEVKGGVREAHFHWSIMQTISLKFWDFTSYWILFCFTRMNWRLKEVVIGDVDQWQPMTQLLLHDIKIRKSNFSDQTTLPLLWFTQSKRRCLILALLLCICSYFLRFHSTMKMRIRGFNNFRCFCHPTQ